MRFKEWAAFSLLSLIWGSSFLWIKVALQETGPLLLVALRRNPAPIIAPRHRVLAAGGSLLGCRTGPQREPA